LDQSQPGNQQQTAYLLRFQLSLVISVVVAVLLKKPAGVADFGHLMDVEIQSRPHSHCPGLHHLKAAFDHRQRGRRNLIMIAIQISLKIITPRTIPRSTY
jgi:hypothetical protein